MELLQQAEEPVWVPACGTQHESMKATKPRWSLPKASRATEKKVFISNKHSQDLLGKDSPGFAYTPNRQAINLSAKIGTAASRPNIGGARYPETCNNLIGLTPDPDKFKWKPPNVKFGQSSRDACSNSPDFEGYPPGVVSPGPQRYNPAKAPPCVRLAHAPDVDKIPPKYTMRMKTKIIELESQTPAKVGPGYYPQTVACGEQHSSVKETKPQWKINRTDRFQSKHVHGDAGRLWDGEGNQKIMNNRMFNRSPSFSFGTSTRDKAKRVARMETHLDKGPAAQIGAMHRSLPNLPPRREILKYSDSLAAS